MEQPELAVRQVADGRADPHLPAREVEGDARAPHEVPVVAARAAPEVDAHARDQLVERERLRDEVRGAKLEAAELRGQVGPGGEHEHRKPGVLLLERAQDLEAVPPREQQVEHDEVPGAGPGEREPLDPVAGALDCVALGLEAAGDEREDPRLVFDHQDSHRTPSRQ